jgi:hypothetical protein
MLSFAEARKRFTKWKPRFIVTRNNFEILSAGPWFQKSHIPINSKYWSLRTVLLITIHKP